MADNIQVKDATGTAKTMRTIDTSGSDLHVPIHRTDANVWYQESITAQSASATVTGTTRDAGVASGVGVHFGQFNAFAYANVAGTLRIEASFDGSSWVRASADAAVAAGGMAVLSVPLIARYFRAVYANGAGAQTTFRLSTSFTAG